MAGGHESRILARDAVGGGGEGGEEQEGQGGEAEAAKPARTASRGRSVHVSSGRRVGRGVVLAIREGGSEPSWDSGLLVGMERVAGNGHLR